MMGKYLKLLSSSLNLLKWDNSLYYIVVTGGNYKDYVEDFESKIMLSRTKKR